MTEPVVTALVVAETIGIVVGVPLLILYGRERIKNLARESTERALADYKHKHDEELAALHARHQRELHEFGLYRQQRHAAYAKLYRKVSIAADLYGAMLGLQIVPDFAKYGLQDAQDFFARHEAPASAAEQIIGAFEGGRHAEAHTLLSELYERLQLRDAGKAFIRAKNYERTRDLYLSDAVRSQMDAVRGCVAAVSVSLDRKNGRDLKEFQKKEAMQHAVTDLFKTMRSEMDHT